MTEKLLDVENETMMKVADLEKLLLQKDKDLQMIRVSNLCFRKASIRTLLSVCGDCFPDACN